MSYYDGNGYDPQPNYPPQGNNSYQGGNYQQPDSPQISNIICKGNGKDRVVDFRDCLNASSPREYANMHQSGGTDKATGVSNFASAIEVVLCDYSRGKGDRSVTLKARVEPSVFYEWLEVCKNAVGSTVIPLREEVQKQGGQPWEKEVVYNVLAWQFHNLKSLASSIGIAMTRFTQIAGAVVKGRLQANTLDFSQKVGSALKQSRDVFGDTGNIPATISVKKGLDYSYSQERVNSYKTGPDGYAPVSILSVDRHGWKADGHESRYPWVIKIVKGEAQTKTQANGATTYIGKTMRNKQEVYIALSDRDMFRMMMRVTRFIECWEMATCIPVIKEGENMRAAYFASKAHNNY